MPFPANLIGHRLQSKAWDVSTRSILVFAAGVGASEPAYLDDLQEAGPRALPFQCVSLEWPVVQSLDAATRDVLTPREARRVVHAAQDSTFHRPMRPGDALITEGELVAVRAVRAGALTVLRLITRDRASGEPVTTTWTTSIYRDVPVAGDDASIAEPEAVDAADLSPPGPDAETAAISISRQAAHVYSACADIWNPIHTERAAALAAGLPDVILHGTATWALAGLTLLRRYADNDVGALKRFTGRFSGMVTPGETIAVRHERAASGVVCFEVRSGSGAVAISQGLAWL